MAKIYYKNKLASAPKEFPQIGREVYINTSMNPDSMGYYFVELYINGRFIYQARDLIITKAFEKVSNFLNSNYESTYEEDGRTPPWEF